MTCQIPLLLLLWLNTFETKSEDREPLLKLVFQITLDLFDGTEMLLVIPEVNDLGIPKRCEEAITTFVCISFMLSHFQLEENKISDKSIDKKSAIIGITFQFLLTNCVFLGLRLALCFKFKRDASIFMAKNGILIIHWILEIFQCCNDELRS